MGTRGVIAIPDADHGWRGRYVHWDSYPQHVGESLRRVVVRDGYVGAVEILVHVNYGWSSLDPDTPATAELGRMYDDGRFQSIPGYGTAYTTVQNQSSPDDWILADGDDWGTEWAYLLGEGGIGVFERRYGSPEEDEGHGTGMFGYGASDTEAGGYWRRVGFVAYGDEEGMAKIQEEVYTE